jgi:E3 ubiquitin-protein ligase HECTD3
LNDLKAIDFNTLDSLEKIINMDKKTFEASVFENFTTTLSDKTSVELLPGGKERSVTYEERELYASLVQQARLNESSAQMKAMWKGNFSIF